jgi:hypothetical protein
MRGKEMDVTSATANGQKAQCEGKCAFRNGIQVETSNFARRITNIVPENS